jgi:hypothetical protein
MLVTLEQAKAHLRLEDETVDFDLNLKIHAASGAVLNYLKGANRFIQATVNGILAFDVDGDPIYTDEVLFEVQAATLLMLGVLYVDRDGDKDHEYEPGYLPRSVTALLYPLRTPALA